MAATPFAWRTLQIVTLLAAPALLIGGIRLADFAQAQTPRGDGTLRGLILASLAVLAFVANDAENGTCAALVAVVMTSIAGECGWLYAFALSAQARRYPGG